MQSNHRLIALAAIAAAAGWLLWAGPHTPNPPGPVPEPPAADAPDLYAVFSQSPDKQQAKTDAAAAGHLLTGLAETLTHDGTLAGGPRIKTSAVAEDVRVLAREYLETTRGLGTRHPAFGSTVGPYLESKVGADGSELTAELRGRWVNAYRALAGACASAARRL